MKVKEAEERERRKKKEGLIKVIEKDKISRQGSARISVQSSRLGSAGRKDSGRKEKRKEDPLNTVTTLNFDKLEDHNKALREGSIETSKEHTTTTHRLREAIDNSLDVDPLQRTANPML